MIWRNAKGIEQERKRKLLGNLGILMRRRVKDVLLNIKKAFNATIYNRING